MSDVGHFSECDDPRRLTLRSRLDLERLIELNER
jgi:hypothetical protein